MATLIWLCVGAYCIAVAAFIYSGYRRGPKITLYTKAAASSLFMLAGALCTAMPTKGPGTPAYAALMLTGLGFGMLGDVLLECQHVFPEKKSRFFVSGLGAFLLGHLFYIVLFLRLAPLGWVQPITAVAVFAVLYMLKCRFKVEPGKMTVPVYLYAAIVSVMVGAALAATLWHTGPARPIFITGALFFCISDALLAYLYFGPKKLPPLRAINVSYYYAAQMLFALSIWRR